MNIFNKSKGVELQVLLDKDYGQAQQQLAQQLEVEISTIQKCVKALEKHFRVSELSATWTHWEIEKKLKAHLWNFARYV